MSSIQIAVFMILGCIAEIAGFYVNSKNKVFTGLEEDEEVVFTMLAEEYSINHTPGPWHVAVAVSNKRLFLSGETIKGQMFSHCGMDTWDLKEIKSVALKNHDIIITTGKDKVKLRGKEMDRLITKLEKSVSLFYVKGLVI